MRPQFHHIDAQARLEQMDRRRAERGPTETPATEQARTIFENIRSADQPEVNRSEHFQQFLQRAREEQWTPLRYHNEDVRDGPNCLEVPRMSSR